MSGSELKRILEDIVREKGGKIWVARRIGRRISYLNGLKAGEEMFESSKILHDDGEYVIFAEGIAEDEWVKKKIKEFMNLLKNGR